MSGSITFRYGPFAGWSLTLFATYDAGDLVRTLVQLVVPPRRDSRLLTGVLSLRPGIAGFDESRAAVNGGADDMEHLLTWVIEASRVALIEREDIDSAQREHWQSIVESADASRRKFLDRCPTAVAAPFEVVGRLWFTDEDLVSADE